MSAAASECVLIATGSASGAEDAARRAGLVPRMVLAKHDCAGPLGTARREARARGLDTLAIHSADWDRQTLSQLFELAALRLGVSDCRVLVGDGSSTLQLSRGSLMRHVAELPVDAVAGLSLVGLEVARFGRSRLAAAAVVKGRSGRDAVLAVWPGAPGTTVGGAVTHMSGVLAAFKRRGLRIGLLALSPPPPQLARVANDIEVALTLPRAARTTGEVNAVCANRAARAAGRRLLQRLEPLLVYQRHEAFVTYGADLARSADVPLVLEWNNSEAWAHRHWHVSSPVKRVFSPLAAAMERHVLQRATVVAAVSTHSANEALAEGASGRAVVVLPNGVDIEAIDLAREAHGAVRPSLGALVGWVGSFDPWHGADVLIKAMASLPESVGAVLVGEGAERSACQSLARDMGLEARVRFPGALPHSETVQLLSKCDVLASPHVPMPTRPFFGSPTKIFEYMAIGRPIVASALEQIGEVLEHGRTAILVTPGDAQELGQAIRSVLDLPERGSEIGAAARREAELNHTWDARVRVILDSLNPGENTASSGASIGVAALEGGA